MSKMAVTKKKKVLKLSPVFAVTNKTADLVL